MFNKTFMFPQTKTEHIPYCREIKEVRAPTDDSIRLYEEIKEKAYNSILDTIELRDNSFNLNAILYDEFYSQSKICKYKFSLNGKDFQGEIKSNDFILDDKNALIQEIIEKASKIIALELAKIVFKK